MEFDWDAENLAHIARHGVSPDEVEFALDNPTLEIGYQDWYAEEERFEEIGMTQAGRLLTVITTWRGNRLRTVTAFDAPSHLVKEYFRARGV